MPEVKQVNRNLLVRITPANQSEDWLVIWESQLNMVGSGVVLGEYSAFIHTLNMLASIQGLEERPLPINIFEPELNNAERLNMARDYQNNSPRVELEIAMRLDSQSEWCEIGAVAMLPVSPYFKVDLLEHFTARIDFLLGRNTQIGLRLKDVGYGLLKDGSYLAISGAIQEQQYYSGAAGAWTDTWNDSSVPLIANVGALAVAANPRRKYLSIINNGNETAFLSIGSPATLDQGIVVNPKGGSYTIEWQRGSYTQQPIYAVAKKNTTLVISEGSIQ